MANAKKNTEVSGTKPEGTAAKDAAPAEKRRPLKTFREDDVSCSVWSREHVVQGKPKLFYSCTFERSYKDRDGAWRYTKTIDAESLGKLVTVCKQAAEFIQSLHYPGPEAPVK